MTAYSVLLFIVAMMILLWGLLLYKGNLSSLRPESYKRVKDKMAYGKAMGKAVFVMGFSTSVGRHYCAAWRNNGGCYTYSSDFGWRISCRPFLYAESEG